MRRGRLPWYVSVPLLVAWLATATVASWLALLAGSGAVRANHIVPLSALVLAFVAVLTYAVVRRLIGSTMTPLGVLARDLRDAALRPRDHISVWRSNRSVDLETLAPEVADLLDAIGLFVGRVEQRHARQTAWIGAVVHDIKTPIAASANALAALSSSPDLRGTEDAGLIARVADELRELVSGVQRMLDVVRLEREDVPLERVPVDLAAMVKSIVERAGASPNLDVSVRGEGTASVDRALLERAVENLIANGMRYARTRLAVEIFPGMIRVSDDGLGMPAPLEHLAQPFRSEPMVVAGVQVAGGAGGIGLFLAQRVMELHGGKLVIESTGRDGTVLLAYVGATNGG